MVDVDDMMNECLPTCVFLVDVYIVRYIVGCLYHLESKQEMLERLRYSERGCRLLLGIDGDADFTQGNLVVLSHEYLRST